MRTGINIYKAGYPFPRLLAFVIWSVPTGILVVAFIISTIITSGNPPGYIGWPMVFFELVWVGLLATYRFSPMFDKAKTAGMDVIEYLLRTFPNQDEESATRAIDIFDKSIDYLLDRKIYDEEYGEPLKDKDFCELYIQYCQIVLYGNNECTTNKFLKQCYKKLRPVIKEVQPIFIKEGIAYLESVAEDKNLSSEDISNIIFMLLDVDGTAHILLSLVSILEGKYLRVKINTLREEYNKSVDQHNEFVDQLIELEKDPDHREYDAVTLKMRISMMKNLIKYQKENLDYWVTAVNRSSPSE